MAVDMTARESWWAQHELFAVGAFVDGGVWPLSMEQTSQAWLSLWH